MEQRGQLITAIFNYNDCGQALIQLDPICEMAFSFICDALNRDIAEYEKKCAINRENGRKGGRPKKTEKIERFYCETEKPYNDNGNDNVNDNDNDNVIDNGSGNGNGNGNGNENEEGFASTTTRIEKEFYFFINKRAGRQSLPRK
jgi:hypothetical protein